MTGRVDGRIFKMKEEVASGNFQERFLNGEMDKI